MALIANLLPFILIIGVMWVLIFLPQQRRMKAHRELLSNLAIGDQVLLSSGIYGEVIDFDGPTLFLAVSDDVAIKVTKESVSELVEYADADDQTEQDNA